MARIKAKPTMHRLPIAPVQIAHNKNGFRATPPPPVFDTAAVAYSAQQRFAYVANGAATIPQGTVPYTGQVQMFVSLLNNNKFNSNIIILNLK